MQLRGQLHTLWDLAAFWQQELLLFSAFWFLIGAADDIMVDLIWGGRTLHRWVKRYRKLPPMRAMQLPAPQQSGLIVVFIPAWQEAAVIGSMLARTRLAWFDGAVEYRIYVGCYPNDPDSVAEAMRAARHDPHVSIVLCDNPGPTTKADCLNRMWRALLIDEFAQGTKAKAIVLHDAEDAVHHDALRVIDYLIEKAAAVQLPVIPMQVPGSKWISAHYCDEFAEAHGKSLVVREAIGAALPLAGVGCAIERNRLGRMALERSDGPFDQSSLTEDYELGLGIGQQGGRVIFARMLDQYGALVGTRACFPDRLDAAVRQKARWMTGIALAGWDRLGWQGGVAEFWMRLRDRKAIFAAIVLTVAYLCIALTALLILGRVSGLYPALPPMGGFTRTLLILNAILLAWRMIMRAIFVGRSYGFAQALLSIPRNIIANIIAIMAARRACWNYLRYLTGRELAWEKTTHNHFPVEASRHV